MDLLDTKAAAGPTGLAPQTLRKARVTGGGPPFIKIGRAVRYDPADIAAWVAERRMLSTSQQSAA